MSFKQFFKESVKFDEIPPKAKFQLNDVVLVYGSLPKKWSQYNGKLGTPVGRVGYSMLVKYAIKMDDGEVILINSSFVHGPFKDRKVAQKYVDNPKKQIDVKDLKSYVGNAIPFASNLKIETYMKNYLAPLGYQWLTTPKVIKGDNNTTYTIFAQRPIDHPITEGNYEKPLQVGVFSFYKQNNSTNKKLKSDGVSKLVEIIKGGKTNTYDEKHPHYIQDAHGSCPYFVEVPAPLTRYSNNLIHPADMFQFKRLGVNSVTKSLEMYKDRIYGIFDVYSHVGESTRNKSVIDEYRILKSIYPITEKNGVKTIHSSINYNALKLSNPYMLKDFIVEGDFVIEGVSSYDGDDDYKVAAQYWSSLKDFSFMPRSVRSLEVDLNAFVNIKTTKGMPKIAEGIKLTSKHIISLEDMPVEVNGNLLIGCKNLKSLAGCSNIIKGQFLIYDNNHITTLVGGPEKVEGGYTVTDLTNLKSLVGMPKIITTTNRRGRGITIHKCGIETLEGAPEIVEGNFDISQNQHLRSLKGSPEKITDGRYDFHDCPNVESLEGITLEVHSYSCQNTKFTKEDIERAIKVYKTMKQGASEEEAKLITKI
jgi:hypothetical protein